MKSVAADLSTSSINFWNFFLKLFCFLRAEKSITGLASVRQIDLSQWDDRNITKAISTANASILRTTPFFGFILPCDSREVFLKCSCFFVRKLVTILRIIVSVSDLEEPRSEKSAIGDREKKSSQLISAEAARAFPPATRFCNVLLFLSRQVRAQ